MAKTRRVTATPRPVKYLLRLYVSRSTARSTRAVTNIRRLCEEHLHGRYDLEVIDINDHAELARDEQITAPSERYVLRLYVTGMTARSARAIARLRAICDEFLAGHYDLEIVDIYQQPVLLQSEQILAAPTLIKKLPLPVRRIIGDMSDRGSVLLGLDLPTSASLGAGGDARKPG